MICERMLIEHMLSKHAFMFYCLKFNNGRKLSESSRIVGNSSLKYFHPFFYEHCNSGKHMVMNTKSKS